MIRRNWPLFSSDFIKAKAYSVPGVVPVPGVVLIDEIESLKRQGNAPAEAVVGAGVSRLRPVSMAALTTALGMVPLLFDAFFVAMAVTIVFGLMIATVLTMVVVPVLYAILFRLPTPENHANAKCLAERAETDPWLKA